MGSNVVTFADRDMMFFSDGTPADLSAILYRANEAQDPAEKGDLLRQAVELHPEEMDAHIALYKFYFRTAQLVEAERAAWAAMSVAAEQGGFDRNYRKLTPETTSWLVENTPARFYLFTLKALGVIRLRRAKPKAALTPLAKLMELDPYGEIGGADFYDIAVGVLEAA